MREGCEEVRVLRERDYRQNGNRLRFVTSLAVDFPFDHETLWGPKSDGGGRKEAFFPPPTFSFPRSLSITRECEREFQFPLRWQLAGKWTEKTRQRRRRGIPSLDRDRPILQVHSIIEAQQQSNVWPRSISRFPRFSIFSILISPLSISLFSAGNGNQASSTPNNNNPNNSLNSSNNSEFSSPGGGGGGGPNAGGGNNQDGSTNGPSGGGDDSLMWWKLWGKWKTLLCQ